MEEQQNAWPGNRVVKCAMRYKFGRKFIGNESSFFRMSTSQYFRWDQARELVHDSWSLAPLYYEKDSCQNRLGCRNLRRHSHFQTRWTHIFFSFSFSLSFLLVALALACDKPVGLSPCASKGIIYHLLRLVDLCWTKRMTGKSLCEMRGCVYISTQIYGNY